MIWDTSILGYKCTFRNNLLKVLTFSSSTPWLLIAHHNKLEIVCHSVTKEILICKSQQFECQWGFYVVVFFYL